MCGWCYKTGSNGYSVQTTTVDSDRWAAKRLLSKNGADKSWSACFIEPNAKCPVCNDRVYFYQNQFGSRVFFDELGWPWPKHPCTDNSKASKFDHKLELPKTRLRGMALEILSAAKGAHFDPGANFRSRFGNSPWDLLSVTKAIRRGFENYVEGKSISPPLDEPKYFAFKSATITPTTGDFFSSNGEEVSFLEADSLQSKELKGHSIEKEEFELHVREIDNNGILHDQYGSSTALKAIQPPLSEKFDDALIYASQLHRNQVRKGSEIPYIAHLLSVSSRVLVAGGSEVQAIAGLLHDAAEDQGGKATLEEIRKRFGSDVAQIVADCTDSWVEPKPDWRPRKEAYLSALPSKAAVSLLVSLADKVDNAEAILNDYRNIGDELWSRFTGGRQGTIWYYRALTTIFTRVLPCALADELSRTVSQFPD